MPCGCSRYLKIRKKYVITSQVMSWDAVMEGLRVSILKDSMSDNRKEIDEQLLKCNEWES